MKLNKRFILPVAALAILSGGAMVSISTVSAHGRGEQSGLHRQANLTEAEKAQMKAERETKNEARLQALVDEGKLTQAQKDALIAKHNEMRAEREVSKEEFKNMSNEEHKTLRETKRAERDAWLKEQGIDPTIIQAHAKGQRGGR